MAVNKLHTVPVGALCLMIIAGILLVDIQIDKHATTEEALIYYRITHNFFPLRAVLFGCIIVGALDLMVMTYFYPSRLDLVSLTLAGYVLYLFVGAIAPQLEAAIQPNAEEVIITAALETIRDVHVYMFPTILLLIVAIAMKHRGSSEDSSAVKTKSQ
ncbi:uncharacterized protein MONBRDRAFT_39244 [Monosiga brevicollis MX1]|uniref:Uncharacterized protein n=1 Tax=Monosiga brevicollis TaxID=81824 RepID=A9VD69_MONBE|nr:uncharacterized protein MONBRDRAFT_39244 [Monosiga brevicollis MX1]EDQ84503.1 predicted protein [Monosiga brevicollis MX1]|eukprot:XP_001750690.1 hypothetical protein [Monosiga brevicollis MX1]